MRYEMKKIVRAGEREFRDMGWLQTHWLFSFGDYYDPNNLRHGSLRVFNDDVVQAKTGFGTHPHSEMEIISVILSGEMEHRDSMCNTMILAEGDVQRMSAGTGLTHSEKNEAEKPVAFFQIWIEPDTKGLQPSYDIRHFNSEAFRNKLTLFAANGAEDSVVSLNTEAKLFRGCWETGFTEKYVTGQDRAIFVYMVEGSAMVNGELLGPRDQLRLSGKDKEEM